VRDNILERKSYSITRYVGNSIPQRNADDLPKEQASGTRSTLENSQ
jgi:hypothetical protein